MRFDGGCSSAHKASITRLHERTNVLEPYI
jgi:hypothetical protein